MTSRRLYSTCAAAAMSAALACVAVLGGPAANASVRGSAAGPAVVLSDATLTVGTTLYSEWDATAGTYADWVVPMTLHWTVTAAAGVCAQTITERGYEWLGGDHDPILGSDTGTTVLPASARAHSTQLELFDYYRGGYEAVVRVTDCNGVTVASTIGAARVGLREDNSRSVTYSGKWKISKCVCSSGLSTHYTTRRGSSVRFATNPSTGNSVGLVMAKGPAHGRATVYVDGVKVATLHTYARTALSRAIVWQRPFTDGVSHVITVVNEATPGHARLDLDAIVN